MVKEKWYKESQMHIHAIHSSPRVANRIMPWLGVRLQEALTTKLGMKLAKTMSLPKVFLL